MCDNHATRRDQKETKTEMELKAIYHLIIICIINYIHMIVLKKL